MLFTPMQCRETRIEVDYNTQSTSLVFPLFLGPLYPETSECRRTSRPRVRAHDGDVAGLERALEGARRDGERLAAEAAAASASAARERAAAREEHAAALQAAERGAEERLRAVHAQHASDTRAAEARHGEQLAQRQAEHAGALRAAEERAERRLREVEAGHAAALDAERQEAARHGPTPGWRKMCRARSAHEVQSCTAAQTHANEGELHSKHQRKRLGHSSRKQHQHV